MTTETVSRIKKHIFFVLNKISWKNEQQLHSFLLDATYAYTHDLERPRKQYTPRKQKIQEQSETEDYAKKFPDLMSEGC